MEVFAESLVLDGVPANGDAEAQPAAGEDVDGRRLLGDEGCLPLGQDDDAADELDAAGERPEIGEEDERFVELALVRIRAAPTAGPVGVGAEYVVEGEQVAEAQILSGLGVVAQNEGIRPDLRLRKDDADLHAPRPPLTALLHLQRRPSPCQIQRGRSYRAGGYGCPEILRARRAFSFRTLSLGGKDASQRREGSDRAETAGRVIEFVAVLLFVGVDISLVVVALVWLSDRRSQTDPASPRRPRRRYR